MPAFMGVDSFESDSADSAPLPFQFHRVTGDKFDDGKGANGGVKGNFERTVSDGKRFGNSLLYQIGKAVFLCDLLPYVLPCRRHFDIVHVGHHDIRQTVNNNCGQSRVQLADFHARRRHRRPKFGAVTVKLPVHLRQLVRIAAIPDAVFNGIAHAVQPFVDVDRVGLRGLNPQERVNAVSDFIHEFDFIHHQFFAYTE